MEFFKASTIALVVLLVIAGIAIGYLLAQQGTTCSTTVTLNATCNGSAVTVNSTANATPASPLGSLVKAAVGYGGVGAIDQPLVNPPRDKIVPAPEFPSAAVPVALVIGIGGSVLFLRWRRTH